MTDAVALWIIVIGIAFLGIIKILNRGNYEEDITLEPGTYLVGYDIKPGKGDLKATSGGGNFCVRSKTDKAWEIGNNIGTTSALQPSRFRNLILSRGDILEINGNVEALIMPPDPILNPSQDPLCPGIYRFGVDVPPGKYDLEVVSGDGDVLLVEVHKDQYSFYQDMSLENPFKASSFKNVTCTRDYELWINGNLQIKLVPSERQPRILRKLY